MRQLIPEGLAEMAPGPELSAMLAGIDIHASTGADLVEVLCARSRQLAHEQAQLLATMVEIGLCDPGAEADEVARLTESPPYAADEIRAALAWTRRAADRELDFAQTLVLRMPAVFTALEHGRICRSKAWVFADLCADLTAEQTHVVCDRVLPTATRLTTGELAARIKKMAIALDPDWAARRYATAVRERNVIGYLIADGTATVTGSALPVDQAAAACARVEDLARAAKRAGHNGRVGPLRADIYLGLLDGRWQHLDRDQIIADLLACASADSNPADGPNGRNADNSASDGDTAADAAPTDAAPTENPDDLTFGEDGAGAAGSARPARQARVGVELRVGLSTLLGRDQHPGEIAGWGPVTAEVARTMAVAQRDAEWRFAITASDGKLLLAGITRRRPYHPTPAHSGGPPPCRGGIVELHIPATLLAGLAGHLGEYDEWSAVLADIAAQYSRHKPRKNNPTARFAGAALRRHVQIRDRFCVYPGCRSPARGADIDHTRDHALGGTTTDANSGPLCQHDHRLKHVGGWRLHQPEPGHFVWISPLGRRYPTQPPPITTELPEPLPRPDHPNDPSFATVDDWPILEEPPSEPDPPTAPTVDDDEPPPF